MEMLRLPLPVSRAFALRSVPDTPDRFLVLGGREPKARSRPGTLLTGWSFSGFISGETGGSPSFPEDPFRRSALLSDPGRISTPDPLRRFDVAPAIPNTKAPPLISISGLNRTALRPAAYA